MSRAPLTGWAAIALGVGFNLPYVLLALRFDYPAILRRPAPDILQAFAAAGPALVLIWWAFMLAALALVPLGTALAITPRRMATRPALALGAALFAALAGTLQAIGLARWVFVVPHLHGTAAAAELALINAYGGVAIGEHLGQLLTALFVAALAVLQWGERARRRAIAGGLTALLLAIGTGEGLALALGASGDRFALATIGGFLALTGWLVATGTALIRAPRAA